MDTYENYLIFKKSKIQRNSLIDLPENILLEILSKLPLKSVFVCRCVCKSFKALASPSSHFNSLYSRRATQTIVLQIQGKHAKPTPYLHMIDHESDVACSLDIFPVFRFDIPKVSDPFGLTLKNSCNGLVYLAGGFHGCPNSIIFNPLTNEHVTLPRGDIDGRANRVQFQLLGFGAVSNRYKVIRILLASVDDEPCGIQVHVVGSGLWRDIETGGYLGPRDCFDLCSNGTYVNGAAYVIWRSRVSNVFEPLFGKEEIKIRIRNRFSKERESSDVPEMERHQSVDVSKKAKAVR